MKSGTFWTLNFIAFLALSLAINIIVTRVAIKNKTWSPYGAPDLIAGFASAVAIIIMAIWLIIFFSLGMGYYIQ